MRSSSMVPTTILSFGGASVAQVIKMMEFPERGSFGYINNNAGDQ